MKIYSTTIAPLGLACACVVWILLGHPGLSWMLNILAVLTGLSMAVMGFFLIGFIAAN